MKSVTIFAAVRAQPALPRTGVFGMRNPRRRAPFRITPAGIRSSSALRNACVSWAAEFGGARRAEPEEGPQGPDAADTRLLDDGRSANA